MNFYRHHLGDYDGATAHLSWDEDMAYARLLRAYYRTEKPILGDQAYRLVRASTRAHRAAVDSVLREFFEQREDGWHQKRCDEEIEAYREDAGESAAKKDNERERQKRYRERRKQIFDALREHGIVPKWDTPLEQLEADLSRVQLRDGNAPVTRTDTAIHKPEPRTKNQKPEENLNPGADAPDWLPPEWGEFLQHRKEKRQTMTPTAIRSSVAKLGRWRNEGKDIAAIIRHSIEQGYTGIFEPPPERINGRGVTSHNVSSAQEWLRREEEKDAHEIPGS